MSTRVRRATFEDGLDVFRMTEAFVSGTRYGQVFGFNPDVVVNTIAHALKQGVIFVGQVEAGSIAGEEWRSVAMIAALIGEHYISGEKWVEEMAWWSDPTHRRGLLTYKLLGSLEDWSRQNGAVGLKMVAPTDSEVGQFYTRVGYKPLETAFIKRL